MDLKLKERPYNLFIITGMPLIVSTIAVFKKTSDIHFHDTYFVTSLDFIYWLLAILLLVLWVIYQLTDRYLFSRLLTWMHVLITVLIVLLIAIIPIFQGGSYNGGPPAYYDSIHSPFKDAVLSIAEYSFIVSTIILAQVFYLLNLVMGLVRYFRR